ncbi:Eco57I restriction-modification methylase domain-containing protein [Conexibacter sp. S30A1]|uniref:Eco57I restriction-modification methylase domain-containing protein n=1 Tax=Conexibacter sp. S30A1 TaxID=2937800 RepID=UPI00200BE802|nr:type IIL restriction-modification enzyme MmeI [Conexibacter sp. S30A1]
MPPARRARPKIASHHAEWLSLVQTKGPFLTVPVLEKLLPDGLEAVTRIADLRLAYAEWQHDRRLQQRWIMWVLTELLDLREAVSEPADTDPAYRVPVQDVLLRASYVVRDHAAPDDPVVLLVHSYPHGTPLHRPLRADAWAASPLDRAAELARATGHPLALVTNGMDWTLVWARPGESTGICAWRAELWLEEPLTLRAFVTLLGARRFFALPAEQGLTRLLAESAGRQQEVADQLGTQVRHAVELLITTLDRADRDRHGELLGELEGAEVYRGAVTAIMRLVFLFVAEERRLLPIEDQRYAQTLAASTLRAQLRERADRDGEDPLERSTAAWHRVLALFRAVHGGIEHDALRLPAYGGGLFDPDRYPFLEGRPPGSSWHEHRASPLPVDDRTMLHLLDALQTLLQGDSSVLLSYEALDVEQIGHVYEGLLDHTALRITDTALACSGRLEPELLLGDIERWAASGEATLIERLAKETGRSAAAIAKTLDAEPSDERRARLRAVCSGDDQLLARIAPFHGLLREDLRGDPLVFLAGSLFVTQALDRRSSGTYYTPRELAEEVVHHALDPIVYDPGPAQERDERKWKLRPAAELLELRVADIAMGSGAFLVAACRYLAKRLQEAWDTETSATDAAAATGPLAGGGGLPADPLEREALAHRLIAERCLYGVDKNPMAVEMAKLSLWLITLAKDRPFSFVDHALRLGDSLLGVTDLRQLRVAHIDPSHHRQASLDLHADVIDAALERALMLRRELEDFIVREIADAERKALLLAQAQAALADARLIGDLIVAAALAGVEDADPLKGPDVARRIRTLLDHGLTDVERAVARTELRALADDWLVERRRAVGDVPEVVWDDRRPFHWALEFPEVSERGGFDAIVGNPPFQGGKKITGALGTSYRSYLVRQLAGGVRGNADLVAYFYLRAAKLLRPSGGFGLIATNTLAQGDTREVGLDQLHGAGWTFHRAISSEPWPGGASLEMATVWARRDGWSASRVLDGVAVGSISPALTPGSRVGGNAQRLQANRERSFIGSYVLGMGFVLSRAEADAMKAADPRNEEVVRPYLVGEDLNSRPDGSPTRCVVDFRDWPIERAREYTAPFARVEDLVRPERADLNERGYRERWWQFGRQGKDLYRAIAPLDRCIAITLVSKVVQPMFVPTGIVYAHALGVFAYDDDAHFGLLSSGFHWWWAVTRASTLETRVRYTPTDCFETFPQPELTDAIGILGGELNAHRSALMLDRQEGLTRTYNRVHDPDEHADDIVRLRELHVQLDRAVRDAYGWSDLELGHGFHETRFGVRYTFAPAPRQELLDRLLELNHERYAEEVRRGLHAKTKPKPRARVAPAGTLSLLDD